jgi:hypothetical protein
MREDEDGTRSMHGRDQICIGNFKWENLKGRDHLGELGVDEMIIIK